MLTVQFGYSKYHMNYTKDHKVLKTETSQWQKPIYLEGVAIVY